MARSRRALIAALASLTLVCMRPPQGPGAGGSAQPQGPEDADLMAVVPAAAEAVLSLDLTQLRASPWSRPVLGVASPEERAASAARRGFDEAADVDLWVMVKLPAPAGTPPPTLEIFQGRFDRARVRKAFQDRRPGAAVTSFGGVEAVADADEALALLTPRTLVYGPPPAVRAAVEAAHRRGRSARQEAWVERVTTALDDETGRRSRGAAIQLALLLTDDSRAELRAAVGLDTESMSELGGRLTLASDARATLVATTSGKAEAVALADKLTNEVRSWRARRSVGALGLRPVLERVRVFPRGPRVVMELNVSESDRETLSARVAAFAEILGKSRGQPAE